MSKMEMLTRWRLAWLQIGRAMSTLAAGGVRLTIVVGRHRSPNLFILFEQLSLLVTVIGQTVLSGGTWLEDFINVQVFGVRHLRLLHFPLSLLARSCLPAQLSHIVASI